MTSTEFDLHVLVPAYGASPHLEAALVSVLGSAAERTLVTVVDDGSPGTEVQTTTSRGGSRIEYVRLERNLGVAGAFQACVERSRGEYTTLLGSDDLLDASYVTQVRRLVRTYARPTMVLPGVNVIGPDGGPLLPLADRVKRWLSPRREGLLAGDRLAASLLVGNWLYFPAIAWRTDALQRYGFRQDMQTALDLDVELRMAFDGQTLAWSPTPAFSYRRHPASFSSVTAVSGERFAEERSLFVWAESRARELGWRRSAVAARLHPTSRLHRTLVSTSAAARRSRPG